MPADKRLTKAKLAKKVVAAVEARDGHFVRKLDRDEASYFADGVLKINNKSSATARNKNTSDLYIVVPQDVAVDKAKQSFRHQRRIIKQEKPPSPFASDTIRKEEQAKLMNKRPSKFRQALTNRAEDYHVIPHTLIHKKSVLGKKGDPDSILSSVAPPGPKLHMTESMDPSSCCPTIMSQALLSSSLLGIRQRDSLNMLLVRRDFANPYLLGPSPFLSMDGFSRLPSPLDFEAQRLRAMNPLHGLIGMPPSPGASLDALAMLLQMKHSPY
jgi:hypothetical protein